MEFNISAAHFADRYEHLSEHLMAADWNSCRILCSSSGERTSAMDTEKASGKSAVILYCNFEREDYCIASTLA